MHYCEISTLGFIQITSRISLNLHLVLFLGQENNLHGRTALASIQVDISTIALFLCCTNKDAVLLHDDHFIHFATLYTHTCCKGDRRKQSVIKFSDLLVYCIMFKVKLCIFSFKFKLSDSSTPSSILKI